MPAVSADSVTESSKEPNQAPGVTFLRMENNAAVYKVGSGTYSFASQDIKSIVIDMPNGEDDSFRIGKENDRGA